MAVLPARCVLDHQRIDRHRAVRRDDAWVDLGFHYARRVDEREQRHRVDRAGERGENNT